MAYDPVRHKLVYFGGSDGQTMFDEVWELER
jgi:hypothetical protein